MARRFAGMFGVLIIGVGIGIGIGIAGASMIAAQQPAPPAAPQPAGGRGTFGAPAGPCGPQAQLPAEFSKNVDPKSRCFEVRMYTVDKTRLGTGTFNGGINELHQRFREQEVAIFQKHGAQIVGVWQHLGNPDTLVWMLAYRDRAHREDVWAKFAADPDWKALSSKYSVPITPNVFLMSAVDYSALK